MSTKKMRQQFADTMLEVGRQDSRLAVLIGDISHFILQPFARACPGRFYNVGICEPAIISMAAGLRRAGLIPVAHTIAPFILERSFEQIKLDFCYQGLGGNIVTVGSAFDYSNLGCTHHCYDDFALLKALPNTQIVYPASPAEFDLLFRETYRNDALTVFRLPEHQHGLEIDPALIRFGRAIKVRAGNDLTVVAVGPQLKNALSAARVLAGEGRSLEVLYCPTVHPLDTLSVTESVARTRRVLVVEEHGQTGSVCDDVRRVVMEIEGVRVAGLGIEGFVHDYGTYDDLCARSGLTIEGVLHAARGLFAGKEATPR